MKIAVLLLLHSLLVFAGCARSGRTPDAQPVWPSASATYPSPDGRIFVTVRHARKPYSIAIRDRESGKLLGSAPSIAHLINNPPRLEGKFHVTFADDLSTVVVHEDFTDGSASIQYVLFRRAGDGRSYRAVYLRPPAERPAIYRTVHSDFGYDTGDVQAVTRDTITFNYPNVPRVRTLKIAGLIQSAELQDWLNWRPRVPEDYDIEH